MESTITIRNSKGDSLELTFPELNELFKEWQPRLNPTEYPSLAPAPSIEPWPEPTYPGIMPIVTCRTDVANELLV